MNKKVIHLLILILPVLVFVGYIIFLAHGRYQLNLKLSDADRLVWESGEPVLNVRVSSIEKGEILHYVIQVTNDQQITIYEDELTVDRDMFGGGFIRAVQADKDSDLEILIWTRGNNKYILDYQPPHVKRLSFDSAPKRLKDMANQWHRFNVIGGIEIVILLVLTGGYYLIYAIIRIAIGIIRSAGNTKKTEETDNR